MIAIVDCNEGRYPEECPACAEGAAKRIPELEEQNKRLREALERRGREWWMNCKTTYPEDKGICPTCAVLAELEEAK